MSKFVLEKINEIAEDASKTIYKLRIDDECQFDLFCSEVRSRATYDNELDTIFALINRMATTNLPMPPKKFNSIEWKGKVIAHEFKSKHLRVYIKISNASTIILGGYKAKQKKRYCPSSKYY